MSTGPDALVAPAAAEWRESVDLNQFAGAARRVWMPATRDFVERSAGRGVAASEAALRPRVLRDVNSIHSSTQVLGTKLAPPVIARPSALHNLSTADGELATIATAKGPQASDRPVGECQSSDGTPRPGGYGSVVPAGLDLGPGHPVKLDLSEGVRP